MCDEILMILALFGLWWFSKTAGYVRVSRTSSTGFLFIIKRKRKLLWKTSDENNREIVIFSRKVLFERTMVCFRKGLNNPHAWFLSGFIRRLSWSLHQWKKIDWLSRRENKRMRVISTRLNGTGSFVKW